MKPITFDIIEQAFIKNKYNLYLEKAYDLNLFGIRSNNSKSDSFDDFIGCIYIDDKFKKQLVIFPATTDPGKHWLLNPMNVNGTIIMVPGQYRSVYKIGYHNLSNPIEAYSAFQQIGLMIYVRDNDKSEYLNFDLYRNTSLRIKNLFTSMASTNIHRASKWKKLLNIGMYSAGCQVLQNDVDLQTLLNLGNKQIESTGYKKFTYTLFEESEI
jgi:hypothetical protein